MLPCVEILTGNVTKTDRRPCRLRLGCPDNIDLLVTMSPHFDQLTQFCLKTKLSSVNSYCYSQLPPSPRLISDQSHNLSHNVDTEDKTASQI